MALVSRTRQLPGSVPRILARPAHKTRPASLLPPPVAPAPLPWNPRTVRIIGPNNGAGISRERDIIAAAFRDAGWGVMFAHPQDQGTASSVAANVHLEILAVQFLAASKRNILVPNTEWWMPAWTPALLRSRTLVWAKTEDAARIFLDLGADVDRIGFRSMDRHDPDVPRKRAFLHVAGSSPHKGTAALVGEWRRNWPQLTILSRKVYPAKRAVVSTAERLTHDQLQTLQNEHLFHIYPSRYEGWGHAQWEGLSCGAVVFATNAPPFEERPQTFRLLEAVSGPRAKNDLLTLFDVVPRAIAEAVEWAMSLSEDQLLSERSRARLAWESTAATFEDRIRRAIDALEDMPEATVASAEELA